MNNKTQFTEAGKKKRQKGMLANSPMCFLFVCLFFLHKNHSLLTQENVVL